MFNFLGNRSAQVATLAYYTHTNISHNAKKVKQIFEKNTLLRKNIQLNIEISIDKFNAKSVLRFFKVFVLQTNMFVFAPLLLINVDFLVKVWFGIFVNRC